MFHYLYCKRNEIDFKIESDKWLFKYQDGWTDYFEEIKIDIEKHTYKKYFPQDGMLYENTWIYCNSIMDNFTSLEVKEIIPEFYKYNSTTMSMIESTKNTYNLELGKYDSIFIRRGDKLVRETKILNSELYIELLLEKNPECKQIFLQTDDYNCFIDLQKYIDERNLNIELITMCNPQQKGCVISSEYNLNDTDFAENQDYFKQVKEDLLKITPVDKMIPEEVYQHTMDMIVGIELCIQSNYCILDYQSNVSRFIKLAHPKIDNVISVERIIPYLTNWVCPAYVDSFYENSTKM
jgi:hypothetical protein